MSDDEYRVKPRADLVMVPFPKESAPYAQHVSRICLTGRWHGVVELTVEKGRLTYVKDHRGYKYDEDGKVI